MGESDHQLEGRKPAGDLAGPLVVDSVTREVLFVAGVPGGTKKTDGRWPAFRRVGDLKVDGEKGTRLLREGCIEETSWDVSLVS